jgi:1,4-dihydroxy-6-naphthoate synthase
MKLSLAFSPCPNDTFIFDALVNHKIDTKGLEFEVHLEDVQTLNKWALQQSMDISKISYGVYPLVKLNYNLLQSGGALGKGVGPLLVAKNSNIDVNSCTIAIPGENTTAHFLFSLAYPNCTHKKFMPFNEIEDWVLKNENVAGVIIHENRFTYEQKGLYKLQDLGKYWETTTQLPIPLGGIVVHKKINETLAKTIDGLIKQSIEFAFAHYPNLSLYVTEHAQEMNEMVMRQHIDLYVNNYSLQLGKDGLLAVERMLEVYESLNA